jgi:predicted HTH transcriptional regulator
LIGFAELAGSGLREVQRVWRNVNRRPPLFESSPGANTFTLILDWRELPEVADQFWKQRLGVVLSPHEAKALLLSAESDGVGAEEISSATGVLVDDANEIISALKIKALVDEKKNRINIKDHLRNLVAEAKQQR